MGRAESWKISEAENLRKSPKKAGRGYCVILILNLVFVLKGQFLKISFENISRKLIYKHQAYCLFRFDSRCGEEREYEWYIYSNRTSFDFTGGRMLKEGTLSGF
jgi:hypothetical protein